ncbi:MAG: DUF1570 domain-containing protein, partial [Microthrixaceae bacterium]|nr:DUF1570 domain-containing protein [Microthrixaceae bacterium]
MNLPRFLLPIILAVALSGAVGGGADTPQSLRTYDPRYYQLHTDLPPSEAGQVGFRMTCMVEEYRARTRAFSGALHQKLPFYLFRDREAYLQSGGLPGPAGVFKGDELLAVAGERLTSATWTVIQHEAFHQFARQVIGGDPPVWVNEGLADYFGEALFTGDRFVTGLVPAFRLQRIQQAIRNGSMRSLDAMMRLSHDQWNADIQVGNYDQAWSMVYFLAHGDGGKYQAAFERYMDLIGRGHSSAAAWGMVFGDSAGFERRWRDYWLSLPPDPTARQYVQISAEIYTRLLAGLS